MKKSLNSLLVKINLENALLGQYLPMKLNIKKKKRIEYKRAWLEIYDVPIAYFPYFFHPDPTVERQSGFFS